MSDTMKYWVLVAIAVAFGFIWYREYAMEKEDPQAIPSQTVDGHKIRTVGNVTEIIHPGGSRLIVFNLGKNKTFRVDPRDIWPWLGDQLDIALERGGICDAIPTNATINNTHRMSSDKWHDPWWSWFELYEGRFACSDSGIRMDDNCHMGPLLMNFGECLMTFSGIHVSYRWRLAVQNGQLGEPLAIIEAGNVSATAKCAEAMLRLQRDYADGRFHVVGLDLYSFEISKMVFGNSTITWCDKKIDTRDRSFRYLVRRALSKMIDAFMTGPLLDSLQKAFEDASDEALETSKPIW